MIKRFILFVGIVLIATIANSASTFSIILIPDTQADTLISASTFTAQCQWILDNEEELNIQVVIHLGDITDTHTPQEWANAEEGLSLIRASSIPMVVARGNHDSLADFISEIDIDEYYNNTDWFNGSSKNGTSDNIYAKLTIEENDFIFILFDDQVSNKDRGNIVWATQVALDNPDYYPIFITHAYLQDDNQLMSEGSFIWYSALRRVQTDGILVCGHWVGTGLRQDYTTSGNILTSILYDRQDVTGEGWLRQLIFDPDNGQVTVKSYSVINDIWDTDADMQYTIDYIKEDSSESFGISNITVNNSVIKGIEFK